MLRRPTFGRIRPHGRERVVRVASVTAAAYLIVGWQGSDMLLKLALINYIVIFWHQFEEYRLPGGEPAIAVLAAFVGGVMLRIGYGAMKNPRSPHPFPANEFERGGYAERIRQG